MMAMGSRCAMLLACALPVLAISGTSGRGFGYRNLSSRYAEAANERFKASTDAVDFVFMMVRVTGTRCGLAQVSKKDGGIVALIDLHKDKTPSYEVDSVANRVYYRVQPNELVGYRFGAGS